MDEETGSQTEITENRIGMTKTFHVHLTVSTPKECSLGLQVLLGEMSTQAKEPEVSEETSERQKQKGFYQQVRGWEGLRAPRRMKPQRGPEGKANLGLFTTLPRAIPLGARSHGNHH